MELSERRQTEIENIFASCAKSHEPRRTFSRLSPHSVVLGLFPKQDSKGRNVRRNKQLHYDLFVGLTKWHKGSVVYVNWADNAVNCEYAESSEFKVTSETGYSNDQPRVKTLDVSSSSMYNSQTGEVNLNIALDDMVALLSRIAIPQTMKRKKMGETSVECAPQPSKVARGYNTDVKQLDTYKEEYNRELAQAGAQCRQICSLTGFGRTGALYLDASSANTSKALHLQGYRGCEMHTPNESTDVDGHDVQRDVRADIHTQMRAFGSPSCDLPHVPRTTIENFIKDPNSTNPPVPNLKYSYVWIDGMCTWEGSGSRCTGSAVLDLFTLKRVAPYAVVAYTASLRGKKGDRVCTSTSEMRKHHTQIESAANDNGYNLSLPKLMYTRGSVYTVMFRVYPRNV